VACSVLNRLNRLTCVFSYPKNYGPPYLRTDPVMSPAPSMPNRPAAFRIVLLACLVLVAALAAATATPPEIRIEGSGVRPQLGFACCDQGIAPMQALFADHDVVAALHDLHAQVAVAIADFSPERAQVVRFLNQQQIPVIAGVTLQTKDGPYFNADDAAEAPAQFAAFEKWTRENGLRWDAVGLDIEPNFGELAALKNHRWRLITTLLRHSLDGKRIERAQVAYSALIRQIQAQGYSVLTFALPYIPVERKVHTTLLDRMLGVPDVEGNKNYVMIYTSYARSVRPAIFLDLGQSAQAITIGVTYGPPPAGSGFGPLNWEEFSGDLIVASHFTNQVGVYSLEGCVQQGFLPRLETMDWSASVAIPAASIARADRHVIIFEIALWTADHVFYLAAVAFLLVILLVWRRRVRKRRPIPAD